jgi:hypothetical protein
MTYRFRGRANPWTDQQNALLWQMREVEGLPWPEVAKRLEHPKGSCQTRLSMLRRDRVNAVTRDMIEAAPDRNLVLRAPANLVMPPALPPSARTMRTAILVADAELRARCEVLGLTGGLFGDPLPGRSALDQRRELARHALGLPNKRNQSYRNHFVAGERHPDYVAWCDMVAAGLARGRKGSAFTGGDNIFWLTAVGAKSALKKGEALDPEDFPVDTGAPA